MSTSHPQFTGLFEDSPETIFDGLPKVAEPLVGRVFRNENVRIFAELKRYVEAQPKQRDLVCP